MFGEQLADPFGATFVGRPLGAQIRTALGGIADVRQQQVLDLVAHLAARYESRRRDPQPLLIDVPRTGGHAAGRHPTDIGVVSPRRGVGDEFIASVGWTPPARRLRGVGHLGHDRRDHRHVRKVGPAGEGIVQDEHVAGVRITATHRGDGVGHRAEMDRDVFGLGNESAVGVEDRRRAVPALGDVRRIRPADQHVAHLLGDAL